MSDEHLQILKKRLANACRRIRESGRWDVSSNVAVAWLLWVVQKN